MYEEVFLLLVPFRSKYFDKVITYIYSMFWVQRIYLANAYFTFKLNMVDVILNRLCEAFLYRVVRFWISYTVFK